MYEGIGRLDTHFRHEKIPKFLFLPYLAIATEEDFELWVFWPKLIVVALMCQDIGIVFCFGGKKKNFVLMSCVLARIL